MNIPNQVLSTGGLFGIVYIIYRGIANIILDPPSVTTCFIVLVTGITFGIMATIKQAQHD